MRVEPVSSHEFLDRMVRLHACETKIQTLKVETQACVVDPHQLEDGGLQVIYVNWVFGDVKTQFIGSTQRDARADASTLSLIHI